MKKLLKKIWEVIKSIFQKIDEETEKMVPIAIKIVEGIKKVMDSPVDDIVLGIVTTAIPGDADDKLVEKVKSVVEKWLPRVLLELQLIDQISAVGNPNEQLRLILARLKLSSDETKNVLYHGLCALVLEKLADGKLTWSESVAIAEYYYKNFAKK